MCRYKLVEHSMATPARAASPAVPLHQLLELTIEHMQPLQLQQYLNKDKQLTLYERHYQSEFHRCE